MKLIKPLRLSLLQRAYRHAGQYQLGIAALALVPLRKPAGLHTEMELWRLVREQMPDVAVLDAAIPKACPEFLVSGKAYGRYCAPGTAQCEVAIRVAGVEKRLRVSGERHWSDNQPSAAQPFETVALDWAHTYGGAEFADNPLGRGHSPLSGEPWPLPNLEPLGQHLLSPAQNATPVSLGMLEASWPPRYRMSDDYDQRWLEEDYPGFSRNIDWHYFNTAQPDQWFDGLDEIPSGAAYELRHLHPEQAILSGRLPSVRARCFLRRGAAESGSLEEVPLRLTTLWFIPHCERAILIFHGHAPCARFDGSDIACMLLAAESAEAPRSLQHYHAVLEQRLDPRQGALYALRDSDLISSTLIGPGLEAPEQKPLAENALAQRMSQRAAAEREKLTAHLARLPAAMHTSAVPMESADVTPIVALPPEQLPGLIADRERLLQDAEINLQTVKETLRTQQQAARTRLANLPGSPLPATPRNPTQGLQALRRQLREESTDSPLSPRQREQLDALFSRGATQLATLQSVTGHLLEAQPALDEASSRDLREQIQKLLQQGQALNSLALAGARLAGMNLSGANLAGADLDSADLSACDLSGADLRGALLSRVRLNDANLDDCDLSDANLGLAQLHRAYLRNADLSRSCLEQSDLHDCDLSGAKLCNLRLNGARLNQLNLSRAQVENLFLQDTSLEQLCLHQARIDKLTFYRCTLRDLDFSRADIHALTLIETDASQGISFQAARIDKSCFIGGCDLSRADFSACEMSEVCLRGARLSGADFTFSQLRQSDLSDTDLRDSHLDHADLDGSLLIRADLRGASIRQASLIASNLQNAALQGANLSASNLFRADLGEVALDAHSLFDGSYQQRVKWQPRRPQAAQAEGGA